MEGKNKKIEGERVVNMWRVFLPLVIAILFCMWGSHKGKIDIIHKQTKLSKEDVKANLRHNIGIWYKMFLSTNWVLLPAAFTFSFFLNPYVLDVSYYEAMPKIATHPLGYFILFFISASVGIILAKTFVKFYEECEIGMRLKYLSSIVVSLLWIVIIFLNMYLSTLYPKNDPYISGITIATIVFIIITLSFLVSPVFYDWWIIFKASKAKIIKRKKGDLLI